MDPFSDDQKNDRGLYIAFMAVLLFAALVGILGFYQLVEICCQQSFWPRSR